ncbi:MAG: hypothetical protein HYS27_18245 [Deltaproteobacteria bacterium]|nr:hypothetical protein [Deltaproteobacteria bacterium]
MEEKPPDNVVQLPVRSIRELGLPKEVEDLVIEMQSALIDAYNKSLTDLAATVRSQATALEAIQETLRVVVQHMRIAPELEKKLPAVMRLAAPGEAPTLPVVIADPNKVGFTWSQGELAAALGLTPPDVSVLARAFKLDEDPSCAVVVRAGKGKRIVNYHPRAAQRFRQLLDDPPQALTPEQRAVARRVRDRVGARKP